MPLLGGVQQHAESASLLLEPEDLLVDPRQGAAQVVDHARRRRVEDLPDREQRETGAQQPPDSPRSATCSRV
ncbi:hypothetical protein [Propionibacterium acidifaciens]|uniref:hypothetical protein n=1 Tax=Propionibacterium acidifaciens TaxID=556499 RepID=UPI0005BB9C60|nr:hypothetical protein [Propionibacterium acidifaciens]AYW77447.1 hypothetical protein EGX94_04520 [Propionibacterium acidifaciens]